MTDPVRLLTPDEASDVLGVPRSRVLALVRSRSLGAVKLGPRTVRIPREAIEAYITAAYYPAHGEEGQGEGQRAGLRLSRHGSKAPVVRHRHDRVDARRASGPPVHRASPRTPGARSVRRLWHWT